MAGAEIGQGQVFNALIPEDAMARENFSHEISPRINCYTAPLAFVISASGERRLLVLYWCTLNKANEDDSWSHGLRPVNTTAAPKLELLLAWILVLYRENDDGSQISWGARNTGGQPSETSHSLDLSNVPFQKICSLTSALEAVQQLDPPTLEQESTTQNTLFFNNGSEAAKSGREKDSQNNFREWTYQIEVSYIEQELTVKADWSRTAMSTSLATTRLNSFIDILITILDHPERSVSDATGPTLADLDQLWSWNATLPPLMEQCMHDLIAEQAASQPDAHAIESWDGTFTYAEVEDLSTRLAKHLVARGAQVGGIIPLCFEKSRWTIVALLAVMKAGSAFALTDPSQPEARLRTIVEQTDAKLLITSQLQSTLA
ncbi:Nonribosomal peptide synthetase 6 like protein [Verticillium longisporum]|nr:Nonribosomal peptide synthetase 6 like protein [Verticillium longisporum]